jgi:hypothetical protein
MGGCPGVSGLYRPFDRSVAQVKEAENKANYHGLLYGAFGYAVRQGYLAVNPCARTAPTRSRIKQSQADLHFLEAEFASAARLAGGDGGLLRVAVGTGMRFGEPTVPWASQSSEGRPRGRSPRCSYTSPAML